jgi:hypothetical protein
MAYGLAMSDRVALARAIAVRTKPRFIEIPRERRSKVPFTGEAARPAEVGRPRSTAGT